MSNRYITAAMECKVGNPTKKLILIKLADNANDDGICWPSYGTIARHCEVDKRTVIRHIKDLQDMGILSKKHRVTSKGNSSNYFQLSIPAPAILGGDNMSLGGDKGSPGGCQTITRGVAQDHPDPSTEPSTNPQLNKQTSVSKKRTDPLDEIIQTIFEYWKSIMGKSSRVELTAKRKSKVRARLKQGFEPRELCEAIKGCSKSPWNMGDNPSGAVHDDLELICRDDQHVNRFLSINRKVEQPYKSSTAKTINSLKDMEFK